MGLLSNFLGNRGRHARCPGHHIHLDRVGWTCCGCRERFSADRSQPRSTGVCRVQAAGERIAVPEEQTVPISASRLRLAANARADLDDRSWYRASTL